MKPISIQKLAEVLNAQAQNPFPAESLIGGGVSIDSRAVVKGDCFFAIKGTNFNGHDFIDQAFSNGAVCAVVQDDYCGNSDGLVLKVNDTVKALGDLARWYRNQMDFKVVAITGSAGKTTTREIIYHVLKRHFKCRQSPKSFNNNIGLPLSLLCAEEGDEIVVVEIGSNWPGEILYLSAIAQPDIAIVTNVYPVHLAGLGSMSDIITEKVSIRQGLRPSGTLLVNGDFKNLVDYCKNIGCEFTTFGKGSGCAVRGDSFDTKGFAGEMVIDSVKVQIGLAGRANLENCLAGWAVCKQLGVSIEDFAGAVKTVEPMDMRLQVDSSQSQLTIINDCYNANPASMANALEYLAQMGQKGNARLVFICGRMAELGSQSQVLHAQLGSLAAAYGVELLLAVGPFAETVAKAAEAAAKNNFQAHIFKNTDMLCNNLQEFIQTDDIVLVKGSRCEKLEKAVAKLKRAM